MSHIATQWAWNQRLPPQRKLVLMRLADRADKHGRCRPSVTLIAEECSMSVRTVQRHLRDLEQDKLVEVEKRYRLNGSQRSNGYLLCAIPLAAPASDVTPPTTSESADDQVSPLELSLNPVKEKQLLDPELLSWPRSLVRYRDELIQMLGGIDLASAQQLIDELAGALAAGTIKSSPVRWFSSIVKIFEKGDFKPTLGLEVERRRQDRSINLARSKEAQNTEKARKSDPKIARKHIDGLKQTVKPK